MLFLSAVSPKALELLTELQDLSLLEKFYLVGGTALALHLGHRISVDLDFFTSKEFDTSGFIEKIQEKHSISLLAQAANSLTLDIDSVKTDFIRHNYPLIRPILFIDGIKLASVEDIAAMKLNSTVNRGSKKDFFDVCELLKHYSLKQLLSFHSEKYDFSSQMVVLKSLVYFEDAEKEPDPVSTNSTSWQYVKVKLNEEVRKYSI
ncbi:MAG: nucleotidyl transferase AbiEii/AbiGii toxin family protein [Bacteroidetes bacterium]|nr:nucleotidyl transferase AbiEii/AbiGii toxin family protein [Bacteroidota bacterium]MBL0138245.1 nucleotidyl transferase AbiEii/AbiGii toxin family protein [Bacteroidota bacterium]